MVLQGFFAEDRGDFAGFPVQTLEKLENLSGLFDVLYKLFRLSVRKPQLLPDLSRILVNFANKSSINALFFQKLCGGSSKLLLNELISCVQR